MTTPNPIAWMAQQLAADTNIDPALADIYRRDHDVEDRPTWVECGACYGTGLGTITHFCISCGGRRMVLARYEDE